MTQPPTRDELTHGAVMALLPWWINDSLDEDESRQVQTHVSTCLRCQREVAQLRRLQASVRLDDADEPAAQGLARLRRRVDRDAALAPWRRRWQQWRQSATRRWPQVSLPIKAALAVCVVLFVGALALDRYVAHLPGDRLAEQQAPYHTLSAPAAPAIAQTRLVVVFKDGVTAQQMRAWLPALHAEVVGGPSPEGAFVLAVPREAGAQALEQLRLNAGVAFAQPAPGGKVDTP